MALHIYADTDPASNFSEGDFTNPITYSVDGVAGGVVVKKFYVRNDASNKTYTGISITPTVGVGDNIVDNSLSEYTWKLIQATNRPTEQQWNLITAGSSVGIPQIGTSTAGDTTTYVPFWLRISIPNNIPVKAFEHVTLRIAYTETTV